MRIESKRQFFELWEKGVLGNRTNLWRDPVDAVNSSSPEIGFREIGKTGGGKWEKVPREKTLETAKRWEQEKRKFIMDDGPGAKTATLQGEVSRIIGGWYGYLSLRSGLMMRPAMAAGCMKSYFGAQVLVLLNQFMDPSSRDDLNELLELYPDATIEFTCFSVDVGIFPGRNTIFWETRDY